MKGSNKTMLRLFDVDLFSLRRQHWWLLQAGQPALPAGRGGRVLNSDQRMPQIGPRT